MAEHIDVIINEDGTIELDMHGFQGPGCSEIAEQLAKALGKEVSSDFKPEYYQQEIVEKQKIRRSL